MNSRALVAAFDGFAGFEMNSAFSALMLLLHRVAAGRDPTAITS